MIKRLLITEEAIKIIFALQEKHGDLVFYQSGDSCHGVPPLCFSKNKFALNASDIRLGSIQGCDFYVSKEYFEHCRAQQITLDIENTQRFGFSLEIPLGVRFILQTRKISEEELLLLEPVRTRA